MLLHTFNYFSTSSPYKLRYVSYRGNSFFMPFVEKVRHPCPAQRLCLMFTPQTLVGHKFLEVETQMLKLGA
jgi:hypothetical protein